MKDYLSVFLFDTKVSPRTGEGFPLELECHRADSRLRCHFLYDSDRFEDGDELVGMVRLERPRGVATA